MLDDDLFVVDSEQQARLNALMDVPSKSHSQHGPVSLEEGYKLIKHSDVEQWAGNPRRIFTDKEISDLRDEILENRLHGTKGLDGTGIEQPLIVRPHPNKEDKYLLIEGERRWRATEGTAVTELPCIVRAVTTDGQALEIALVVGLQRENWTPVDEGAALERWMNGENKDGQRHSYREAAKLVGKDKGFVENRIKLSRAGADVQEMVSLRKDTLSHAIAIDAVQSLAFRRDLIKRALGGASVNEIKSAIALKYPKPQPQQNVLPAAPATQSAPLASQGTGFHTDVTPTVTPASEPELFNEAQSTSEPTTRTIELGTEPLVPRAEITRHYGTVKVEPEHALRNCAELAERALQSLQTGEVGPRYVKDYLQPHLDRLKSTVARIEAL